jgi:glycerate kinase
MHALASPASLKGVLSAREAAALLAEGLRRGGAEAEELPIADGGDGTADVLARAIGLHTMFRHCVHDAFGRPSEVPIRYLADGSAVVEAAEAIPLDPIRLEPFTASSRGLGELIAQVGECVLLLVCLGGTATMDAGAGLREVGVELRHPTRVLCDVRATLLEAPSLFGPQKGVTPEQVALLEERFGAITELQPYADLPGAGAAGGLGAALAALGAELAAGAPEVLERISFRERASSSDLVVTGEGIVDGTTAGGKAPGEALRICRENGVRCVVFGGRVEAELEGAELTALSGDPARAAEDLVELGERLGLEMSVSR